MSDLRRVKITSDGDYHGTRVVDMETGKTIPKVASVTWESGSPEDVPVATIRTVLCHIDVETGAEVIRFCPECEKVFGEAEAAALPPPRPAPIKPTETVEVIRPGFLRATWGRLAGWMRGKA